MAAGVAAFETCILQRPTNCMAACNLRPPGIEQGALGSNIRRPLVGHRRVRLFPAPLLLSSPWGSSRGRNAS